jgi:4-hydroxy-4-methyl-2-oxoglutarate aldolase
MLGRRTGRRHLEEARVSTAVERTSLDGLSSALLASAGGERVGVVLGLDPAWPAAHAVGPALTVRGAPADNLALHQAIAAAQPGELVVATVGEEQAVAHCGDVLALAARHAGIAGIVLDGSIRDRAALAEVGVPIFHHGTSPRGPGKAVPGVLRAPIEIRGVLVRAGDLVCADADGVVVVPAGEIENVVAAARGIEERERGMLARIEAGETTLSIQGLPAAG